jgi:hypothetical protein
MDVRLRVLGDPAGADHANWRTLRHGRLANDLERAEVDERDRVAVRRLQGHGPTAAGNRAGEGDDSRDR